jgi:hypothetical protein
MPLYRILLQGKEENRLKKVKPTLAGDQTQLSIYFKDSLLAAQVIISLNSPSIIQK